MPAPNKMNIPPGRSLKPKGFRDGKKLLSPHKPAGWALPVVSLVNLAHRIFSPRRRPGHLLMFLLLATMLTGCKLIDEPIAIELGSPPKPQPPIEATVADQSIERRFTDSETDSTDAVQSALMWSQKYEELSAKAEKLREEKSNLVIEKTALQNKVAQLGAELDRAKTELAEANNFLQQMQTELTKWKSDILGFRDEMRNAQAAQLEALQRVLRILGAEPVKSTENQLQTQQPTE